MRLVFLVYTYNRTDDAKINMELIRALWSKEMADIKIVHAYNGDKAWYPEPHLEDDFVELDNPGHFEGAANLIDAGMDVIRQKYNEYDFTIVLAADTWLVDAVYILDILETMREKGKHVATCAWGGPKATTVFKSGFAVDFFIVNNRFAWQFKMFPIDYSGFQEQYGSLLLYQTGLPVFLEKLLLARYLEASFKEHSREISRELQALNDIYLLKDREPVHTVQEEGIPKRPGYIPKMGLLTHHNPEPKQAILRSLGIKGDGSIKKLLNSTDLTYYNRGLRDGYPYQVLDNIA
jgi:hypothetical protein